jgi:hypothetical protein
VVKSKSETLLNFIFFGFVKNKKDFLKYGNKINKERRRSINATPARLSHKNQWQGAQEDLKQNREGLCLFCDV